MFYSKWVLKHYKNTLRQTEDLLKELVSTGDPLEGKTLNHKEFEIRLNYSFNSFPDIHFAIHHAISDGACVAITWIMTGTNLGNIGDFPPTNKSIKLLELQFIISKMVKPVDIAKYLTEQQQ